MVSIAVKFRGFVVKERYYNEDTTWGVYVIKTSEALEHSNPVTPKDADWDSQFNEEGEQQYYVVIAGKMQHLSLGVEYEITAESDYVKKYNSWQYTPSLILSLAPKTFEESKLFLRGILNDKQATLLLRIYPDIVNQIMQGTDRVDLDTLYGIGEKTYAKIKDKVINNFIIADVIALLQPAGISYDSIVALLRHEENPQILKRKILENPYYLTRMKGYGFKRVDDIALKIKPELRVSDNRIIAFLKYFLFGKAENDGDTWVPIDELDNEVSNAIPECFDLYKEFVERETTNGSTFICLEDGKIGLCKYKRIEDDIVNILKGLNEVPFNTKITEQDIEDGIKQTEKELGFELSEDQIKAVKGAFDSNVMLLTGNAGCVDCDTEFFNGKGWKKISDWVVGDKVLQWDRNGTAELVTPNAYIKKPCDHLWHIQTKYGVDQCLSDEHNMCWFTVKGAFHETTTLESKAAQETTLTGFTGKFVTSFVYNGSGVDLSDELLRLYVAVIADGTFDYTLSEQAKTYNKVRFHIKKERKKERLRKLLLESKLPHCERPNAMEGYTDFYCELPFRTKEFPIEWYNCSRKQLKVLASELPYWDGNFCTGNRLWRISTNSKHNADFIQFVYSSTGYRASIGLNNRVGQQYWTCGKLYTRKSIEYNVSVTNRTLIGLTKPRDCGKATEFKRYVPIDGYCYCFNVPSHYLVLRRNNCIFITGNCGKSCSSRAILNIYKNKSCSIDAASFSAKAARRITEATGFKSKTIHKLLGAKPDGTFLHDSALPLAEDVIFIDEASMLNVDLLHSLLKAVKLGSRIIFVGDKAQLPPIGAGAPFADLMDMTDLFSTFTLTTVHRQAAKSGILTDANEIRKGHFPIAEPSAHFTTGELQDMTYCFRENHNNMQAIAIKRYLKAMDEDGVDNVVLIVPRKAKCPNSTEEINRIIQEQIFPKTQKQIKYGNKVFMLGAKVIQTINDYEKGVVNGEIGYITDVLPQVPKEVPCVVVKYIGEDGKAKFVEYTRTHLNEISLAYCLTCHRFQGSQAQSIVVVVDSSHYKLLSRSWLYTALTRAQKRCLLIAEPNAFARCIKTDVSRRRTWMSLERKNA